MHQIRVVRVRNGSGPTVLLTAGNHGDEFEGQIALTKLACGLQPEQIAGRVIILPMANAPATTACSSRWLPWRMSSPRLARRAVHPAGLSIPSGCPSRRDAVAGTL